MALKNMGLGKSNGVSVCFLALLVLEISESDFFEHAPSYLKWRIIVGL